ncbi:unnamed protein product [Lactuca virosa]|uniref:Uncharacterized protein n=1 Tax=Lactuca virosa TaxID=75947 RepID=A0AAU9M1E7_9ASTR|nr:unnamed protein product [Lactuca virosa]
MLPSPASFCSYPPDENKRSELVRNDIGSPLQTGGRASQAEAGIGGGMRFQKRLSSILLYRSHHLHPSNSFTVVDSISIQRNIDQDVASRTKMTEGRRVNGFGDVDGDSVPRSACRFLAISFFFRLWFFDLESGPCTKKLSLQVEFERLHFNCSMKVLKQPPTHMDATTRKSWRCCAVEVSGKSLYEIINKPTDGGVTPLHMAALNGHVHCLHLLLDLGTSVNEVTVEDGTTINLIDFDR